MMTTTMKDSRLWITGVAVTVVVVLAAAYFGGFFGNDATEVLPEISSSEG